MFESISFLVVQQWLADYSLGILAVVLTFGFMIFVHELGHFVMAKRVGITVHEFALGFGPRVFRFRRKNDETEYCLRLIPLGGFVSMEGEDEEGNIDDPGNFNNKTPWQKFKVIVAGCTMNYITGFCLLLLVGFIWGVGVASVPARVDTLVDGYPLQKAGFKQGDRLLMIDRTPVKDFESVREILSAKKEGDKLEIMVERAKSSTFTVTVEPIKNSETGRLMLGFSPPANALAGFQFIKVPPGEVLRYAVEKTVILTLSPVIIVQKLMSREMTVGQMKEGTAGPLGIGQMLFEVSRQGLPPIIYMCALLSILIGAFNLIPFPALDGSRALFLLIEKLRKKPMDPEKEGFVHQLGFIVLIVFALIVTWNDILRMVKGEAFFK